MFAQTNPFDPRRPQAAPQPGNAKRFPVLLGPADYRFFPDCPVSVPWECVAMYATRAERNHSQTLDELASRGGLCPRELVALWEDRPWSEVKDLPLIDAVKRVVIASCLCPPGGG